MSTDSALIIHRDALPTAEALVAALAEGGVTIVFPAGFNPGQSADGWLQVTVDGEKTGFDYVVTPLHELEADALPGGATDWGDTLLSFGARGSLSATTVSLIQEVMGRRYRAALLVEDELVSPDALARRGETSAELDPDLAATMRGSPAERAAAMDRYINRFYPPVPTNRRAEVMNYVRPLVIPMIVFALFAALYVWTQVAGG
jgi:hypothetical protein